MLQHCSDNTPMLPILANSSTVIALISKMKNTTVRKCLERLSGVVQKGNKVNIYIFTVIQ